MSDFIFYSIIASVVLTILVNLLPQLFPNSARRAEEKLRDALSQSIEKQQGKEPTRVRVFFPWKAMLVASLVLTLLVNLVGWFASS